MKKKGNGDIVLRPWAMTILVSILLAALAWASTAATYKERVGENTRKLDRIESTLSRVEKNQVKIASQLGIELKE